MPNPQKVEARRASARRWGPPGWGPEEWGPEVSGAQRVGARRAGPRSVRGSRGGGPKAVGPQFRAFFSLSRSHFRFFFFSLSLSLGVLSLNFGGVFGGREAQMCTFGLSGCRVKPWRPLGRPELHTTARALQTCTFQGPREDERMTIVAGEGKKRANSWRSGGRWSCKGRSGGKRSCKGVCWPMGGALKGGAPKGASRVWGSGL